MDTTNSALTLIAATAATLAGVERALERHEKLDQARFTELREALRDQRSTVLQVYMATIGIMASCAIAYFTLGT